MTFEIPNIDSPSVNKRLYLHLNEQDPPARSAWTMVVLRYTLSDIPNRVKINLHTSGLCTVHEILINILQTVHSIQ